MKTILKIVNGKEVWTDSEGNTCHPPGIRPTPRVNRRMGKRGWPLHSDSAGVHPAQRQEAYDDSVRNGVPTVFDELGRAVFTDRAHRRRYLRTYKLRDLDGAYGD